MLNKLEWALEPPLIGGMETRLVITMDLHPYNMIGVKRTIFGIQLHQLRTVLELPHLFHLLLWCHLLLDTKKDILLKHLLFRYLDTTSGSQAFLETHPILHK